MPRTPSWERIEVALRRLSSFHMSVTRRLKLDYFDDAVSVGQRIKAAREAKGLSQRQLSFPGCTAAYISRIENGARVPSLQILREFARLLDVSESYLGWGREVVARPVEALWLQARASLELQEFDAARELAEQIESAAADGPGRARALAVRGQVAAYENRLVEAIEALEEARALDPEIEDAEPTVAEALGRVYVRSGDYAAGIAVFLRNYEAAKDDASPLERSRFGSLLANAYVDSGDFARGESVLAEVSSDADQLADPVDRARLLWTQSRVRSLQNDQDAAARFAASAIEILEVASQDYYAALGCQLLAHIELDRGNVERAVELLDRGALLIDGARRPFEQASFRLEQARALMLSGRREEAAELAMALAPLFSEGRAIDSGRNFLLLADVFRELGEDDRAIEVYELAIERFGGTRDRYLVEAYTALAGLLEQHGRAGDALELLKRAMHVQHEAGRVLTETA